MPCEQVNDLAITKKYQSQLEACLKQGVLIKQVSLHVGNGRQHLGSIWWFPANGLLVSFDQLSPESTDGRRRATFWNAFGVTDAKPLPGDHLAIAVEVNLKMEQRARPEGTLLKCRDGTVYLGHSGRIRVGRRYLDLKSCQAMEGRIMTVNERRFIRIAAFGACDAFVRELVS